MEHLSDLSATCDRVKNLSLESDVLLVLLVFDLLIDDNDIMMITYVQVMRDNVSISHCQFQAHIRWGSARR